MKKFLLFILILAILLSVAQKSVAQVSPYIPVFPVKSGVITYNIRFPKTADESSRPYLRITFDEFGGLQLKEYIDETSLLMNGGPFRELFRNDEIYILENMEKIARKFRIAEHHYIGGDEGFLKISQDLVKGRISKSNTPEFTSLKKTGEKTFLGFPCETYEYRFEGGGTNDMMELMMFHDVCLSKKYYIQDSLFYELEARSYSENIPVPATVFDIPADFRIIDGDKLEKASADDVNYPFNTVTVEYTSLSSAGEIRKEGRKTLYINNNGRNSCEEFTGTITQFSLPPEKINTKEIRDNEYVYAVDFVNRNIRRRTLVAGNYDDKSIAERNYIFNNNLYETGINLVGKTNFLGRDCRILEFRIMSEKLEVTEWCGIFLKTRRYMCYDEECKEPVLILEEIATRVNINPAIPGSVFEYPEDFPLTME